MDLNDKIVIYCTADGQTTVDVSFQPIKWLICSTEMKRL